jgi:hypothetical protein
MLIELPGIGRSDRFRQPPRVGGAAQQMECFQPAIELFLGDNDNRPTTLPRHMKRRTVIANLIHVSRKPLTEIAVSDMTWRGLFPRDGFGHGRRSCCREIELYQYTYNEWNGQAGRESGDIRLCVDQKSEYGGERRPAIECTVTVFADVSTALRAFASPTLATGAPGENLCAATDPLLYPAPNQPRRAR